jgi:glycosyltransferase involved in cell wall biosynthesis
MLRSKGIKDEPLISVIVPAYNAETTILETIDSVLQQTYSNLELIVINDGSTDTTLDLLNNLNDERLKIFSFGNAGLAESRNRGIVLATGEYITFIDTDDLWTPDKLEKQLEVLHRNPDAGVAYSWTAFIDESGKYLHAMEPIYFEGNIYEALLTNCFIAGGSNILARSTCINSVGRFDTELRAAEDWDYWLKLAVEWSFVVVPKYQILYRLSVGAMSSDVEMIEANTLEVINRAYNSAPPELNSLKRKTLASVNRYFAYLYLSRSPSDNWMNLALRKIVSCIRLDPKSLLTLSTHYVLWTTILLYFLPAKLSSRTVRLMLRLKGRYMIRVIPELREAPILSRL